MMGPREKIVGVRRSMLEEPQAGPMYEGGEGKGQPLVPVFGSERAIFLH